MADDLTPWSQEVIRRLTQALDREETGLFPRLADEGRRVLSEFDRAGRQRPELLPFLVDEAARGVHWHSA